MKTRKYLFIAVMAALVTLVGCGGSGTNNTISDGRSRALDGTWSAFAFQPHDNGWTTSVELANFQIAQGMASADYTVYDYPSVGGERTEVGHGHFSGEVNSNFGPWLGLELTVSRRGGDPGMVWFSVNNVKLKSEVISFLASSNIDMDRYPTRYDWQFFMYDPNNRGFIKPTTSAEFTQLAQQRRH